MSAYDLISEFAEPNNGTIVRYAVGSWVDGHYVPGAPANITTTISVQPISGTDLKNLPEAQRTSNLSVGYCSDELFTAKIAPSRKADRVIVDGVTYEVQTVKAWKSFNSPIAPHWEVVLAEVNP